MDQLDRSNRVFESYFGKKQYFNKLCFIGGQQEKITVSMMIKNEMLLELGEASYLTRKELELDTGSVITKDDILEQANLNSKETIVSVMEFGQEFTDNMFGKTYNRNIYLSLTTSFDATGYTAELNAAGNGGNDRRADAYTGDDRSADLSYDL